MRLWTLHPRYLDPRGLVALWREALLAQAVLRGQTRGYRHHPQLVRFRHAESPVGAIADYLRGVHAESRRRGYRFDETLIDQARAAAAIEATHGQLEYEWTHLTAKVSARDPAWHAGTEGSGRPRAHPLFRVVPGGVAAWERTPGEAT